MSLRIYLTEAGSGSCLTAEQQEAAAAVQHRREPRAVDKSWRPAQAAEARGCTGSRVEWSDGGQRQQLISMEADLGGVVLLATCKLRTTIRTTKRPAWMPLASMPMAPRVLTGARSVWWWGLDGCAGSGEESR
jgi:hypothetical protein